MTPSGLQFKDLREGTGEAPKPGDTLVVDWSGYTIGYYGRPFEARNKVCKISVAEMVPANRLSGVCRAVRLSSYTVLRTWKEMLACQWLAQPPLWPVSNLMLLCALLMQCRPCPPAYVLRLQPKGGSFTGDDKDFLRFVLGQHQVIPAFEEAVSSMKVGHSSWLGTREFCHG